MIPSLTFVMCVEAGPLEPMTVHMAESIRLNGGRFRQCPIIASTPRPGPQLLPETLSQLTTLKVRYVRTPSASPYPWYGFFNKAAAFTVLEKEFDTDFVCFIDSDMLMLRPPELLDLGDQYDIAACPSQSSGSTTGKADINHKYWEALASQAGLDVNSFPKVQSYREKADMYLYWNTGIFVFRRSTGFIPEYMERNRHALMCGFKSPVAGLFYAEQAALPLTVQKLQMRVLHLPFGYNFSMHLPLKKYAGLWLDFEDQFFKEMVILHYHKSIWKAFPEVVEFLNKYHPSVGQWLGKQGRPQERRDLWYRGVHALQHWARRRKFNKHLDSCKMPV